ncbi:MAG: PEP-CTERM sorting domain-containing protein [Planctomycetota bacterium]
MKNGSMIGDTKVVLMVIGMMCASNALALLDTETYGFYNITNNSAANASIGEAQLSVEVSDEGMIVQNSDTLNLVGFKFMNEGPDHCVITEIYFQTMSLLDFHSIDENLPGVDFKESEVGSISPGNLPGGKSISPKFIATTAFSIEPLNPEPKWGVEPGEWVAIYYTLQVGTTAQNVFDELANEQTRIGLHVQSFDNGGSESFITPEPATMILLGLGGLMLRKRKQ